MAHSTITHVRTGVHAGWFSVRTSGYKTQYFRSLEAANNEALRRRNVDDAIEKTKKAKRK